jgi:hypothetical protein
MVLWEIGRNFPIQKTKWLQLANQIMSTFLELDDASVSETEARQNSSFLTGMEHNSNPSKKVEQDSRPLTDTRETIPRSRPRITRLESSESTVFLLLTVVLQRLSAFIPEMRRANAELQTKDPKMYNIEVEEGSDVEQVVELVQSWSVSDSLEFGFGSIRSHCW